MKRAKARQILSAIAFDTWYKFQEKFIWGGLWCYHAELFGAIDETYFLPYDYDIALSDDFTKFKKIARFNNRDN
jgi:hypothetical protein